MNTTGLIRTLIFLWETLALRWDFHDPTIMGEIANAAGQLLEVYGVVYRIGDERTPEDVIASTIVEQIMKLHEVSLRLSSSK